MDQEKLKEQLAALDWEQRFELTQYLLSTLAEGPPKQAVPVEPSAESKTELFAEPLLEPDAHSLEASVCAPPSERRIGLQACPVDHQSSPQKAPLKSEKELSLGEDSSIAKSFQKLREALDANCQARP